MIELRWVNQTVEGEKRLSLQYRERSFQVDASGAFCGVTDFGDWKTVPHVALPAEEMQASR